MIRSWSRLATASRPASICSTRSFWAAARSSSACPSVPNRSGSNRASNRSTSAAARATLETSAPTTYSWLKVDPVCRRYLATARRMTT